MADHPEEEQHAVGQAELRDGVRLVGRREGRGEISDEKPHGYSTVQHAAVWRAIMRFSSIGTTHKENRGIRSRYQGPVLRVGMFIEYDTGPTGLLAPLPESPLRARRCRR
jgi:hypothetical protein